jgi:pilus assembly protein CpaB
MKKAQIIAISVAGIAALIAFFFAKSFIQPPPAPIVEKTQVDSVQVLVAGSDIPVGKIVNEGSFRWIAWPKEAAQRGYITEENGGDKRKRELSGSVARSALLAGEPVTSAKLIKAGQGGVLAAILPGGILIRHLRGKSGGDEVVSDTLFRNVRVVAIGQQIETKEGKKAADGSAQTATLELTPRQAEMMALANAMGEITLSLRSVADLSTDPAASGGMDFNKQRGTAVRVLRYGAKSRVYGVN